MSHMIIRRPNADDRASIQQLYQQTIHRLFADNDIQNAQSMINSIINEKMVQFDSYIAASGQTFRFLVAQTGDTIIGAAVHGPSSELIRNHIHIAEKHVHEISVYILPEYQQRGVMHALFSAVQCAMRAIGMRNFCLDSGFKTAVEVWTHLFGPADRFLTDFWAEDVPHHIWLRSLHNDAITLPLRHKQGRFTIRRPTIEDHESAHTLFDASIRREFILDNAGEYLDEMNEMIDSKMVQFDADIASNGHECYFLVAECDGQIVGTLCHEHCSALTQSLSDRDVHGLHEISTAYILPSFQGCGIMRALFNTMCITLSAKGIQDFCLGSGFRKAIDIWTHVLGTPQIVRTDYWGKDSDHVIWFCKTEEMMLTCPLNDE